LISENQHHSTDLTKQSTLDKARGEPKPYLNLNGMHYKTFCSNK
jgi:hypothetical protein